MANILNALVTDRTQEDVAALTRKALYLADDLNRVESAVEFVAELLAESGFPVKVNTKTDWRMIDVPVLGQMDRYLANLRTIRGALPVPPGTPDVPEDMDKLTYQEANDIERVLLAVAEAAMKISSTYRHSNAATCGLEDLVR